jgi:hypothetical protein
VQTDLRHVSVWVDIYIVSSSRLVRSGVTRRGIAPGKNDASQSHQNLMKYMKVSKTMLANFFFAGISIL